ncbi:MAG: DinB family protein [Chloroflexi bacterium]|nr:DinB family protein [Chloroflexota bacterium]
MSAALDAIIAANARARADLLAAVEALPSEARLESWCGPAGWSVQDVLAHMATWQRAWSVLLGQIASGERPVLVGYTPNARDPDAADAAYNAKAVAQARDLDWEQVLAQLSEARELHEAAVRGLDALDPARYAEGRSPYRLAVAAVHDREHLEEILGWRRTQSVVNAAG